MLTATICDYNTRIQSGKVVEQQIIISLRKCGFVIEDPSAQEDMYKKIDGWAIDKKGTRHSLQVKRRENGNDIIFEILKDVDRNLQGRDLIGEAELYFVVDQYGYGRMLSTNEIKEWAYKLLLLAQQDLRTTPTKTLWNNAGWQLRVTIDKAHGQRKLMAYFSPTLFKAIWEKNDII